MEKEKVLEIEIVGINDEYSLAKVKKMNKKVIKEKEDYYFGNADSSALRMNSIWYKEPNFYRSYSDDIECFYLYLNSENDCFTIKNILVKSLELFLEEFNKKYGVVKRWCPRSGEYYFYISTSLNKVCSSIYDYGNIFDREFLKSGNYFKTKEEAEIYLEKIIKLLKERE